MSVDWQKLSKLAWEVRERARLAPGGKTQVGCAVLGEAGGIGVGCNIQHKWRCDIHAEVAAVSHFCAQNAGKIVAVMVVAPRYKFTPCGACMDWIFELGGPECQVAFQNAPTDEPKVFTAGQLMPDYPA